MISDNPIVMLPALIGLIFILVGFLMYKFPPKTINWLYGYRTSSSMRSQERWDFAQIYSAKELMKAGVVLILLAVTGIFLNVGLVAGLFIAIGVLVAVVIIMLVRVEKAIKQKFGKL